MMLDPDAAAPVLSILRSDHFYRREHRLMYDAALALASRDEPIDLATMRAQLERAGTLEKAGGLGELMTVADAAITSAHTVDYAKIVLERAILRDLGAFSRGITDNVYNGPGPIEELIESAQVRLSRIAADSGAADIVTEKWDELSIKVANKIDENVTVRNAKGKIGIHTGLLDLDSWIGGFRPGQLIVIGGRASMGKTALAVTIACHAAARERVPTAFFSLEMPDVDIGTRILCSEALVNVSDAMRGTLEYNQFEKIAEAQNRIHAMPFYLDKTRDLTLAALTARCQSLCKDKGVKLILLDYLQLMRGPKSAQNREQEIASISRELKSIALAHGASVIALSQLSREAERRATAQDFLPKLSDLRESGAIEQDADVVLFPWRKIVYNDSGKEDKTVEKQDAKIKIAKQRNGPIGTIDLVFHTKAMRFLTLAKQEELGGDYGRS